MLIKTSKKDSAKKVDEQIRNITPAKVFRSEKHLGKVKWSEDPLEFQKKVRDEWNINSVAFQMIPAPFMLVGSSNAIGNP